MKKRKTLLLFLMIFTMISGLTACGSSTPKETSNTSASEPPAESVEIEAAAESQAESAEIEIAAESQTDSAETGSAAESESTPADDHSDPEASSEASSADADSASETTTPHSDVLVAYFSATGTTKGVAEKIASVTGGDLYEILAAEPYTSDDLNYNDSSSRSTIEQNDKSVRPEIGSEDISLEGYTTMYLGFPIWWGEEPRILDTFVEKYSFEGITVVPFCTSGGSGIGRSGSNMEALAGTGTWLEGSRFDGNVAEADLQSWIEGLQ